MKKILILTLCLQFCGAVFSSAEEPFKKHNWEIGPEISYIRYEEPDVMKEEGIMYGLGGSYAYHNNWMFKVEGNGMYGQVDYTGSGTLDNIPDYKFEIRGLAGYDFPAGQTTYLTPYLGLGYRYLNDDSSGKLSSTGAAGYDRESNYFYTPVGLQTITELNGKWSLGLNAEYDYLWAGKQISHLEDVNPGYGTLKNDQKNGWGLRGSVQLKKKGETADFLAEPYVRYWSIEESEISSVTTQQYIISGYEPKNNSTEIGMKLAVSF